ncbi:PE family protein [Mycobacterium gordonae]|nr:PE family protein [Mycobacterium gordonae]MCQ4363548.1 PE family protein [Mycobacterium gordonae]
MSVAAAARVAPRAGDDILRERRGCGASSAAELSSRIRKTVRLTARHTGPVIANPELIAQAATDLTDIDSMLGAAHLQAAGPTQTLLPAAADEVSAGVAQLFAQHAKEFQAAAKQASAYHDQFVHKMTAAAGSYAAAEAVNANSLLQLPLEIIGRMVNTGLTSYYELSTYIASLPQPFSQILGALLGLPVLIVMAPFALFFTIVLIALFALLAYNKVSIFPPYNL